MWSSVSVLMPVADLGWFCWVSKIHSSWCRKFIDTKFSLAISPYSRVQLSARPFFWNKKSKIQNKHQIGIPKKIWTTTIVTSKKTGTSCPSFRSFYCANVWKLWTVFLFFYEILVLIENKNTNIYCIF